MKRFVVTVDTEGDDLWHWTWGKEITTENTRYIPRFQELCEEFGISPVYLTNYEMAKDMRWVDYIAPKARDGKCEIGMHLHAWNTPPMYELQDNFGGNPYITEYPEEIVDAKVKTMMDLLQDTFERSVISHRAGRWATNETYFRCLARHGIRVDCSVTPELDLSGIRGCEVNSGSDYRHAPKGIYWVHPEILEVPMTTRRIRHCKEGSLRHRIRTMLLGDAVWLRPLKNKVGPLQELTESVWHESDCEHIEFMIHSSELMPGGSPYFKTAEDVEQLFVVMRQYFEYISKLDICCTTLQDISKQLNAES